MMKNTANAKDPKVRIPNDLVKQIDRAAQKNGRSRNSEVVTRLRESLNHQAETRTA